MDTRHDRHRTAGNQHGIDFPITYGRADKGSQHSRRDIVIDSQIQRRTVVEMNDRHGRFQLPFGPLCDSSIARLQVPQVFPSFEQRLQYLQFLQALQGESPVQVARMEPSVVANKAANDRTNVRRGICDRRRTTTFSAGVE